jgi:hypothetical protein
MNKLIIKTLVVSLLLIGNTVFARDIEYNNSEVTIYVTPGEPTQLSFPEEIKAGFKRIGAPLTVDKKKDKLVVFGTEELSTNGEALIVTLNNEESYSLRIKPADPSNPRDDIVNIINNNGLAAIIPQEEENPEYYRRQFPEAQSNSVSGLMKELVLAVEMGKNKIPGYRVSEQHAGEVILNDGTMVATIEKIFMGADLWGYVLNVENLLDSNQQVNPATFRVAGTKAIMAERWELSPSPYTSEQQLAGTHRGRVYIVTKAQ